MTTLSDGAQRDMMVRGGQVLYVIMWLILLALVVLLIVGLVFAVRQRSGCGKDGAGGKCGPVRVTVCDRALGLAGVTPAGMALANKGRELYVANNNNYGVTGGDSVTVLDTCTMQPVATIVSTGFLEPYTVTVDPALVQREACGSVVSERPAVAYVTNSAGSTVSVVDVATRAVVDTITGFDGPSGFAIAPGTRLGFVNNYGAAGGVGSGNGTTVTVVDLDARVATGAAITVGTAPAAVAATPDGKSVLVLNYVDGNPGTGTLSIIDVASRAVVATIPGFSGPYGVAVARDGKRAYVTNFGSNNFDPIGSTVSVVNLETRTIDATVQVGMQPSGVALSPCGRFCYVSNYSSLYNGSSGPLEVGQGTISVIDTWRQNRLIPDTIPVGGSPGFLLVDRRSGRLFSSGYASCTVDALRLATVPLSCC